jgi:hypothetical protein
MTLSKEYQVIEPCIIRNRLYRRWQMKLYDVPEYWERSFGYHALPLPCCVITLIRGLFPNQSDNKLKTASQWLKVCDKECPKRVALYPVEDTWKYIMPREHNNLLPEHLATDGNMSNDSKYFVDVESDDEGSDMIV